jgi:micrococcal nuclease
MSELIFRRQVSVELEGKKTYGRELGTVFVEGQNVNLRMVRDGWAWQYLKYDHSAEPRDAESAARIAKRGLWTDDSPEPPWTWRKAKKERRHGRPVGN